MRKTLVFASLALGTAAMAAQTVPADGRFPSAVKNRLDLSRQAFINEAAPQTSMKVDPQARSYDYETVVLGTSRYDYQSNGSYGKMIAVSSDGISHGSFMGGINITTGRRVQAWCVDAATPPAISAGPTDVLGERTGYTSHATTSAAPGNGQAANSGVVGLHSANGSWIGVDFEGCTMAFNTLQETESTDILWPHIAVDYQDRVHMVCGDASSGVNSDAVWYNASTDGLAWDGVYTQVTDISNTLSETMAAAKNAPGAAVIFSPDAPCSPPYYDTGAPQWHHDVCYYEARDVNNDIFAQIAEGSPVNITNYNCPESTTPFRCSTYSYADIDGIYDSQETPTLHIAFPTPLSELDSMLYKVPDDPDGDVTYATEFINVEPWQSAIWHYNATTQAWGHIAGWLTADGQSTSAQDSMYVGVFRNANDRVQLAHDPGNGYLYALWNEYKPTDVRDPSANTAAAQGKKMGNGELIAACSADNGQTWGPRVNLTNTQSPGCLTGQCLSETFASMAEQVSNGFLHITYMLDVHAGASIRNTDANDGSDEYPCNLVYMRVPVSAVPPHAGEPWDAAGHIGLDHYSRPWYFIAGHMDTLQMVDKVNILNEGTTTRYLTDLTLFHDGLDEFGDATTNLFTSWEVMQGDPAQPGAWIVNPASANDWDGAIPPQSAVLTHLSIGHRGLPLREQAFRFTFDDGTVRVYRFVYQPAESAPPLVEEIDIENLGQYEAITLYHSDSVAPPATPVDFALSQNVPNPFNPATEITFNMARAGEVSLKVFNLNGQMVETLVDGPMSAGNHKVTFNGNRLSSGVYFYTLQAAGRSETRKMLLAK